MGEDAELISLLSDFYDQDEARLWISSPQELLGGRSPIELIREGRAAEVRQLINQLRDAIYT